MLTGLATVIAPTEKQRRPVAELGRLHLQDHDHYEELIRRNEAIPPIACAVAHPCEASALKGAVEAAQAGIIVPILVGPAAKIRATAEAAGHRHLGL